MSDWPRRIRNNPEAFFAIALLVAAICAYYAPVLLGAATFWGGDIPHENYPKIAALAQAMRSGDFASLVWSPRVFDGFPLLAEGQFGAFYPLAWLALPWVTPLVYVNLTLVFSYLLGALATCWFARLIGLKWAGSVFAAFVFAFGGFASSHLSHIPLMQGLPWLPVALCLVELAARRRSVLFAVLAGVGWGIQWLGGHPQMAFMSILLIAPYATFRSVSDETDRRPLAQRLRSAGWTIAAVMGIGLVIAAVYLLPLQELGALSLRPNGRLPYDEMVMFSLPVRNLLTGVMPFLFGGAQGDYWGFWNLSEVACYMGVSTIVLAIGAVLVAKPPRRVLFFAVAAVVALLLALGGNTPLYRLVALVPVFNSLRAPARFVYLLIFCVALLAGYGLDQLPGAALSRWRARACTFLALACIAAGILIAVASLLLHGWLAAQTVSIAASLPGWLLGGSWAGNLYPPSAVYAGLLRSTDPASVYTFLPTLFLALSGIGLLARNRISPRLWTWLGVVALMVDLGLFNARMPPGSATPLSSAGGRNPAVAYAAAHSGLDRTYWIDADQPWIYRSMEAFIYDGLQDMRGYSPLQMLRHDNYLNAMWNRGISVESQPLLSAMNVRFVVQTGLSRPSYLSTEQHVQYLQGYPVAVLGEGGIANRATYNIPPTAVSRLELLSALDSTSLDAQAEAVRLTLVDDSGGRHPLTLRSDVHTAQRLPAGAGQVTGTQPTTSLLPLSGVEWTGLSYFTSIDLPQPVTVTQVEMEYIAPVGQFRLAGMSLVSAGASSAVTVVSHFMRDTWQLVYSDSDNAVYENKQVLPRAYAVSRVRKATDEGATWQALHALDFDPAQEVIIEDMQAPVPAVAGGAPSEVQVVDYTSMRVNLHASMHGDGYLVLSDTFYPGWKCTVDGLAVPIYHANMLFRAVYVPAGEHQVTFTYEPWMLWIGGAISLSGLFATCVLILGLYIRRRVNSKRMT